MKKIFFITIFFTYSFFSYADSNHQNKIDKLFDRLKNTTNYQESKEIESKIWELWTTHPSENSLTALLADGSFLKALVKKFGNRLMVKLTALFVLQELVELFQELVMLLKKRIKI